MVTFYQLGMTLLPRTIFMSAQIFVNTYANSHLELTDRFGRVVFSCDQWKNTGSTEKRHTVRRQHAFSCIYTSPPSATTRNESYQDILLYVQARKRDENTMFCFVFCFLVTTKKREREEVFTRKWKRLILSAIQLHWRDLAEAFSTPITFSAHRV